MIRDFQIAATYHSVLVRVRTEQAATGVLVADCYLIVVYVSISMYYIPANMRRWANVGILLGQRRRRWANS